MRAILVLLAVVLLLAVAGWVSFNQGPDRSSINLETEKIRSDTNEAVETGAEILHKAGDKLDQEVAPTE
jgi:hypothetical protein